MRFLLTNDDGFDAPGLQALLAALNDWGHCVVVAPREHHSGCSHQVTAHRPLRVESPAVDRHRLDGTPVDCTRVALAHLAPEVDWVISGINEGGNLGADVYHSGTVAAAREAALCGRPGIAVSQYLARRAPPNWARATAWTRRVLEQLFARELPRGSFWNVNLPDPGDDRLPEIADCALDPFPLPVLFEREADHFHYRGRYQDRQKEAGCDVATCFAGQITVTQLRLGA